MSNYARRLPKFMRRTLYNYIINLLRIQTLGDFHGTKLITSKFKIGKFWHSFFFLFFFFSFWKRKTPTREGDWAALLNDEQTQKRATEELQGKPHKLREPNYLQHTTTPYLLDLSSARIVEPMTLYRGLWAPWAVLSTKTPWLNQILITP